MTAHRLQHRSSLILLKRALALICVCACMAGCQDKEGLALAEKHCTACHALPAPDQLPRRSWDHVIDYMGLYLGHPPRKEAHSDITKLSEDLKRQGLLPNEPLLDAPTLDRIRRYYTTQAPGTTTAVTPSLVDGPPFLHPRRTAVHRQKPSVTFVKIQSEQKRIYVGDGLSRTLFELDTKLQIARETKLPGPPSSAVFGNGFIDFALLYVADPQPREEAAIVRWTNGRVTQLSGGLPRLAHISAHDFTGDGATDHVAAGFGLFRGALFLRSGRTGALRQLDNEPGWIQSAVYDWNGDGVPDLVALRAQAREGLYWIDGRDLAATGAPASDRTPPKLHSIIEEGPAFGFTSFALVRGAPGQADLLLLVNGDNGDLPDPPLKPYHGIRLFELQRGKGPGQAARGADGNAGTPTLRALASLPLPGAYKVVARDFDKDGDIDLAAIAFYPDWSAERPAGFVYYENLGDWKFRAQAPPETRFGRWITIDAGDMDGDGDEDIVLGSYAHPSLPAPATVQNLLDRRGHTVLVLENRR